MSFENDKNRTKIRGSKFFILVRLGNCETPNSRRNGANLKKENPKQTNIESMITGLCKSWHIEPYNNYMANTTLKSTMVVIMSKSVRL